MLRVLVVDDMPVFVQFMENIIPWEAHGFQLVGTARDGQEALVLATQYQPDIVLTDITMPHMDGLELMKALKNSLPQISVVMITGHTEFQYAREALRHGATDYLVKPFEAQELLITLLRIKQQHIDQHQLRAAEGKLYSDLEALRTATLLRQLLLAQASEELALDMYTELPLLQSLRAAYGFRIAAISFPKDAADRSSIERIVADTLADGCALYQFTDYDDHLIALICYSNQQNSAFYRDDVDRLIAAIQEKLTLALHLGISDLIEMPFLPDATVGQNASDGSTEQNAMTTIAPLLKHSYLTALALLKDAEGRSGARSTAPSPQLKRQRIALEMKAYLEGHFAEPDLGMPAVSRALLVNQTDLRAAFKAEVGLTMTEYVLKLRMEAAQRLMETGQHKLSEIAELVGYEDQAYFSRCYKKFFGDAPLRHSRGAD